MNDRQRLIGKVVAAMFRDMGYARQIAEAYVQHMTDDEVSSFVRSDDPMPTLLCDCADCV